MKQITVVALSVLIACTSPFAPEGLTLERYEAPDVYREWWKQLTPEPYYGIRFEDVEWYKVTSPVNRDGNFPCPGPNEGLCAGKIINGDEVLLGPPYVNMRSMVEHEMCHLITNRGEGYSSFEACVSTTAP